MRERLEFAVDRQWGAGERRQEVARFCRWFGDDAAGDFAANGVANCVFLLKLYSLSAVLRKSAKCEDATRSAVDREPQKRLSPRNRPHCFIGKMRGKEQRLRFSIWLFCCVRLTTSTHDIDFKFSGVKECDKTRLKT